MRPLRGMGQQDDAPAGEVEGWTPADSRGLGELTVFGRAAELHFALPQYHPRVLLELLQRDRVKVGPEATPTPHLTCAQAALQLPARTRRHLH